MNGIVPFSIILHIFHTTMYSNSSKLFHLMFNEGTSDHSKARENMAVVVLSGGGVLISNVGPSNEVTTGSLEDYMPSLIKTSLPVNGHS